MNAKDQLTIKKVDELNTKFLSDLVWLIYSPAITPKQVPLELRFKLNANLEQTYKQLTSNKKEYIADKKYKPLGKYAEDLMLFYFQSDPRYNLLVHNLQLIEDQRTVGELDFLLENLRTGKFIHLEFAIKFYLKVEINGKTVFLGPSTKDWMQRKVNKLVSTQCQNARTYSHLLPLSIKNQEFEPKLLLKGALFYPIEDWENKQEKKINEGWWCTVDMVAQTFIDNCNYYLITKKEEWIFPFRRSQQLLDFQVLSSHSKVLLESRNEVMIVRLKPNGDIIDRGFLVRQNWPEPMQ